MFSKQNEHETFANCKEKRKIVEEVNSSEDENSSLEDNASENENSSSEDNALEEENISGGESSSNDSWLARHSDEESDTTENTDNNLQQSDSDSESNEPLSTRWENFLKDLTWTEDSSFQPIIHPFNDPNASIQEDCDLNINSSPLEILKSYFSEDMMEMICIQTNIYAKEKINKLRAANKLKQRSRILQYTDVYCDEMYIFHALTILMGIIRKPSIEIYWSNDIMLQTPFF